MSNIIAYISSCILEFGEWISTLLERTISKPVHNARLPQDKIFINWTESRARREQGGRH